jgi:hypothetical protein
MKVHVFKATKPARTQGWTTDKTGSNLPAENAPWTYVKDTEVNPGGHRVGAGDDQILADIQQKGYSVATASINFTTSEKS